MGLKNLARIQKIPDFGLCYVVFDPLPTNLGPINYNRLTCLPLPKHPLWYQTGFDQQPDPFDLKNQDLLHYHPSSCKNRLTYSYLPNESVEVSAVNDTYIAFNGYYSFDNGLSISAGYEIGDLDNEPAAEDESESYFVGINGEVGPGELGAALGTYGTMEESSGSIPDRMMYEVYYSYPVNDGMTITPLIYTVEGDDANDADETGFMVKTSFSF